MLSARDAAPRLRQYLPEPLSFRLCEGAISSPRNNEIHAYRP